MIKQAGQIRLPVISGLIHTPTLRSDGSILQTPGFDERTGLFFDPRGVKFLPVLEAPTKEQAKEALARIKFVFREIPYDGSQGHLESIQGNLVKSQNRLNRL